MSGSQHHLAADPDDVAVDQARAQITADLFVERLTGQVMAVSVPVRIDLVVSAESLFADGAEPADIPGLGPIPASVARKLVVMESTSRIFDGLLRDFVTLRDRRCRAPWCDAPIRHVDHVVAAVDGGPTSLHNAQGLCESCNDVKEEPGWRAVTISEDVVEAHVVQIETPTGHRHRSRAPSPLSPPREQYGEQRPGLWARVA